MFIIAMALISVGYTLSYWAANNIKHWKGPDTTDAAPLSVLFGVSNTAAMFKAGKFPIHDVPFKYTDPNAASTSSNSPSTSGTSGGTGTTVPSTGNSFLDSVNPFNNGKSPIPPGVDPQSGNYNIPGT